MKKTFYLFTLIFLLNGCVESIALLGSSVGGASSGKIAQSTLKSTISYGVKKQTGKTPLGHALAYAEKNNPERKKETCISFIEKTRSEFCTIAKKKISLTNRAIKEKVASTVKIKPKDDNSVAVDAVIEPNINVAKKELNSVNSFYQLKKSPRELAIIVQAELKKLKEKYIK
jgi:esterase/lipase